MKIERTGGQAAYAPLLRESPASPRLCHVNRASTFPRHTGGMDRRRLILAALALAPALAAPRAWANEAPKEDRKKGGGASFLQIQALTATVNRMGGKRGVMTVDCGLDIPDEKLRERAALAGPRLRAGFVQSLSMYAAGLPAARAPDADYLATLLQRDADTLLGRKGARLLLGTVMIN